MWTQTAARQPVSHGDATTTGDGDGDCPVGSEGCPCEGDACDDDLQCIGGICAPAECQPGEGPPLHAHHRTHEIFTVLKGAFRIAWGGYSVHPAPVGPPGTKKLASRMMTDNRYTQ